MLAISGRSARFALAGARRFAYLVNKEAYARARASDTLYREAHLNLKYVFYVTALTTFVRVRSRIMRRHYVLVMRRDGTI